MAKKKIFSGIQPSGDLHLGNLLGALDNWVEYQNKHDAVYCIVDLHAITNHIDPDELRANVLKTAQLLLAIGIDPDKCTLFVQSAIPEHSQLAWLLECCVGFGELNRMTQFKDKSDTSDFISAGLFTYPALQAADILLYDTEIVPVGDDQRQHIELTRDIANRFNSRYGETFTIPVHEIPTAGARIMDLQDPTNKMSKSSGDALGSILVLDSRDTIFKKVQRAVTDSGSDIKYDLENKPGITNLLHIMGALKNIDARYVHDELKFDDYSHLKYDCSYAIWEKLEPIQERYYKLESKPSEAMKKLEKGTRKALKDAHKTLLRAQKNIGLLPKK